MSGPLDDIRELKHVSNASSQLRQILRRSPRIHTPQCCLLAERLEAASEVLGVILFSAEQKGVALSDDARLCIAEFKEVHRVTHKLIAEMVDGVPWLFMYDRRKAAKQFRKLAKRILKGPQRCACILFSDAPPLIKLFKSSCSAHRDEGSRNCSRNSSSCGC